MQNRILGTTGITVSPIGLGSVKFGRNQGVKYPQSFELPTDQTILNLLNHAKDLGINLVDTAPAYGNSEERLGKLLYGQRQDWVIVTKAGEEFIDGQSHFDFSAKYLRYSIERSLKRLKTDYLDVVLIHSDGDDQQRVEHDAVFTTLQRAKQDGLIRAYGMSSKTIEGGLLTVQYSDLAMVTYNPQLTDDKVVIQHAYEQKKGIFIKKAFFSGHLAQIASTNPIQTCLDFIFQEPGVTSVIVGTLNVEHLTENVRALG